jgi:hypothetical protein
MAFEIHRIHHTGNIGFGGNGSSVDSTPLWLGSVGHYDGFSHPLLFIHHDGSLPSPYGTLIAADGSLVYQCRL